MRARTLVIGASLGPAALKVITQAFDEAWTSIAEQYKTATPDQVDAARVRLAQAMLSVASEDSKDVELLKQAALQVIKGDYSMPCTRHG